jgi:hypothetical protein
MQQYLILRRVCLKTFFFVLGCYRSKHEFLARQNYRAFLRVSRKELKKRSRKPERGGWKRQYEGKCAQMSQEFGGCWSAGVDWPWICYSGG